ncbi:HAD family hydrolase [Streptacidiphilus rugosus]|uniref:HAD family hydrolase n=1 Tax=Streptacidiphilus rugosus TaxID=405783 RepID=UPI00056BAEA4|nr:HAD family hydrolase [Streptacidiphilus rugosus]
MIKAVMFDFSGTLFRIEPVGEWWQATVDALGLDVPEAEAAACVDRLSALGALPGSPYGVVPQELAGLWRERDLDMVRHRAAYTGLTRAAELPDPRLVDALYERHLAPAAWRPYPDTAATLAELRRRGLPVAVVSNIGWDLRPVFRHHGVDELVDAYVLSFEQGVQKPDAAIFETACRELGHHPSDVLMVGDDLTADAGATALGCAFHPVDHRPVDERPAGLTPLLDLLD